MSIQIEEHISLKPYNTFGLNAKARYFTRLTAEEQLPELIQTEVFKSNKVLWLGGGSNMLLTQDFNGLVVKLDLKGINIQPAEEGFAIITSYAGENWHDFVQYCIAQNLGGLENLSLIPGNVGTTPVQNIGAYGVEIKDHFYQLKAFDVETNRFVSFNAKACNFGYRDSVFKHEGKGRFIVTQVSFKLTTTNHKLNTSYGAITAEMEKQGLPLTIEGVSKAVIAIRQSKLPHPKEIGNSGSFFKNPVVSAEKADALKQEFPELVSYEVGYGQVKLAAGWLIEQSGMKGYRNGDAGVHTRQALVLVNYGEAQGQDLVKMAELVQQKVYNKFGVNLEAEVNII